VPVVASGAESSARAEISADKGLAQNASSLLTSIKSFANKWLAEVKARGILVVCLPYEFGAMDLKTEVRATHAEVNYNYAPSHY
jgi:hypothetical protein